MRRILILLIGAALMFSHPGVAGAIGLGTAGDYNEFIFGEVNLYYTEALDDVAVGGNAILRDFSVASLVDPGKLVVGGNLDWQNGQVGLSRDGSVYVGGSASISGVVNSALNPVTVINAVPVNFGAEQNYLTNYSAIWSQLGTNGSTTVTPLSGGGNRIVLRGADSNQNFYVFQLSGSDLAGARNGELRIENVKPGATILVNISGTTSAMQGFGTWYNGINYIDGLNNDNQQVFAPLTDNPYSPYILYNFYAAQDLLLAGGLSEGSGIAVQGSVLAPYANITFTNGHIEGNLIALSLRGDGTAGAATWGDGEARNPLFGGDLPAVPEPGTLILLGTGLLGIAGSRRRFLKKK